MEQVGIERKMEEITKEEMELYNKIEQFNPNSKYIKGIWHKEYFKMLGDLCKGVRKEAQGELKENLLCELGSIFNEEDMIQIRKVFESKV